MIKKTELTTIIRMQCNPEKDGDKLLSIIFCKDNDSETVQIGETFGKAENSEKYSFRNLFDAFIDINKSLPSQQIQQTSATFKSPTIKDQRNEEFAYIEENVPKDPTHVLAENVALQANDIQNKVDETLNNMDSSSDDLYSLTKQDIQEATPDLDIAIEEDPIGISISELANRGPVPETPPEFKDQLKKIAAERAKKPRKIAEKKIKRKDE